MSSEWFYLCKWRENKQKNWAVIDLDAQIVIEADLSFDEANYMVFEHKKLNKKTIIVNIKDEYYDLYDRNTEKK